MALLLWGTRMIHTGVSRAYGTVLRQFLVRGGSNRLVAFASGMGVAAVLQSSTATALIVMSFVRSGFVTVAVALAAILGAEVSTTLIAQVYSLDLSWLSPVLLTSGVAIYSFYDRAGRIRHIARAMIGTGLMLLALSLLRQISQPLADSDVLPVILAPLDREPMLAVVLGALLTWGLHATLAAVLLFAALAGNGVIHDMLGLYLILGANLGGGLILLGLTHGEGIRARQIALSMLVIRFTTLLIAALTIEPVATVLRDIDPAPARMAINLHTGFSILMALLFLPFTGFIAKQAERLMPRHADERDETAPIYLDESAVKTPVLALTCAARETLRMAETVEKMLEKTIETFSATDEKLVQKIRQMDNTVDRLNLAIKIYLTRLSQESFDPKEADRYVQILTFSTNLEYAGDIIDKSLMDLAEKKIRKQESFSEKGFAEIRAFHTSVLENLRLAQSLFLSEDPELAVQLVEKKRRAREAEADTAREHFKRLREGLAQSIATSALHLDIIRDLRRINSYITSVAFTIIDNQEKYKKKRRRKSAAPSAPKIPPVSP